jgi:hypothetical protein
MRGREHERRADHIADLKNARIIYAKGLLFLLLGLIASLLLVLEAPRLKVAMLLVIAIWAFCRFYFFAFYVIEHYVDSRYRFAGLLSFARHLASTRDERSGPP